jgi:hypothetical protein
VAQDYRDGVFAGVNNLVEVIGGAKPITVEDYVAAARSQFDTDGHFAITDARLRAARAGIDQTPDALSVPNV